MNNFIFQNATKGYFGKGCVKEYLSCLTGAARTVMLDVTVEEPLPPTHPLCALDNCFLTTHIAGSAGQEVWRMAAYMLGELQRLEAGAPTRYGVTTAMLETMA